MSEKSEQNVTKIVTKKPEDCKISVPYLIQQPERDPEWRCYLWGSTDTFYVPQKGAVPNWFIRYMMKICLGCRWERNRNP